MSWIPMRVGLGDDHSVLYLARALRREPDEIVGKLHRLWGWAGEQTVDGHIPWVDHAAIDRVTRCEGFAAALEKVRWLFVSGDDCQIPKWERWNSESAKKRLEATLRQRQSRASRNGHAPVTKNCDRSVTTVQNSTEHSELPSEAPSSTEGIPSSETQTRARGKRRSIPEWRGEVPDKLRASPFPDAWRRWLTFRREEHKARAKVTQSAGDAQLSEFAEWGVARAVAAIEHTIKNQWQGIREPEAPRNGKSVHDGKTTQEILREIGL